MSRAVRAALLLTSLAVPAAADEPAAKPVPPVEVDDVERQPPSPDGRRTLRRMPVNLARSVAGLASTSNVVPALVGAGATGLGLSLDDAVRDRVEGSDLAGLQSFGDRLGDADVVVPLAASLLLAGRATGNQRFRDMTYDLAQAQVATAALGSTLKRVVGRERPNGSNARSFPSGHSYSWFAMATVVERHYGLAAAAPAFALWALTSTSRLANDTHYVSDVVAGAALGFLVARTTVRVNHEPEAAPRARWQVAPDVGPRRAGLALAVAF